MEHIRTIEIDNFKSIRHLKMEGCRRINVLIGPPNVGKSNILEALSLFAVANKNFHSNPDATKLIRMAALPHLFYNGVIRKPFQVRLNNYLLTGKYTSRAEYSIGDKHNKREEGLSIKGLNFHDQDSLANNIPYFFYRIDKNLMLSSVHHNQERLGNTDEIYPSNVIKYVFDKGLVGRRDDAYLDLIAPFGDNLYSFIYYSDNNNLKEYIKSLLATIDLNPFSLNTGSQSIEILKLLEEGEHFTIPPNLLSDTIQRLILYKAAIGGNENSLLLFEEPEAHCFESYILDFTNDVKFDTNGNQFLIVTHSLYVLQEFLREKDTRQEVSLFLVNSDKGETVLKKMDDLNVNELYESGIDIFLNYESFWNESLLA